MFTGRSAELRELHRLLMSGEQVAIGSTLQTVAATGMGGIGKTELAWQYVQAHREDYPGGVWWLSVRGGELVSQIIGCAVRMGLGQPPDEVASEQAKAQWCFDRWLAVERIHGKRLLVLDDVVRYADLKGLLPTDGRFRVLLTTRRKFGKAVRRLELGVLKQAAAFRLLRRLVADDGRFRAEVAEAQRLCGWVGRLPLGIELVGRYLARKPDLKIAVLLERLEEKRLAALALRKVPEEMPYELNLMAAFELSWQELDEDGQRLGCLLSLFALAPIPWELVRGCVPEWDEEELEECRDEQLLQQSLLERLGEERFQLHQVIREAFAAKLTEQEDAEALQTAFAKALVQVAAQTPPIITLTAQEKMREAVLHLEEVASTWTGLLAGGVESIWPFVSLARFYESQSLWQQAESCYGSCLIKTEDRCGPEHPSTATSLNNLAGLYKSMGRYSEAEPLYERSLEIFEAQLGSEHPSTATSLNNLAGLYESMGRYLKAEPLYVRSLEIIKAYLGPEHHEMAAGLNNLAGVYQSLGRYTEAEPLYIHSLEICEAQLGPEHPNTAMNLNNLAELYRLMNRYAEAEPLCIRSLQICEAQLGHKHPSTAVSLNSLAGLYYSMGRYGEAELLYARSLSITEAQLGPEHPDTVVSLNNLAELYRSMGHYMEAESLFVRSLRIREARLGPEHPSTAVSLNNLAVLYESMLRCAEAEPLYVRSLSIIKAQFGTEHPSTATGLNNLALLYESMGRCAEAEPLYKQSLGILEKALGVSHPSTMDVRANYSLCLRQLAKAASHNGFPIIRWETNIDK